jgi:hypothetical protein
LGLIGSFSLSKGITSIVILAVALGNRFRSQRVTAILLELANFVVAPLIADQADHFA